MGNGTHRTVLSDSFIKHLPQCLLLFILGLKQCFIISPCLYNHHRDHGTADPGFMSEC